MKIKLIYRLSYNKKSSLHSKCYRPSGILIHRQNSYPARGRRRNGRREAQRREAANKVKEYTVQLQYKLKTHM
jgi:hypothetical protein